MHMVRHTADAVQFAVIVIDDAIHIGIRFILILFAIADSLRCVRRTI